MHLRKHVRTLEKDLSYVHMLNFMDVKAKPITSEVISQILSEHIYDQDMNQEILESCKEFHSRTM